MTARWYVKSRGQLKEHEYGWFALDAAHDAADAQAIIERGYQGRGLLALVDDERPGLILFGDQRGQFVLLVTGLIPEGDPEDYRRRPIRVTLIGTADQAEAHACRGLVAVAAEALHGSLASKIPISYAGAAGDKGFDVDDDAWARYVEELVRDLPDGVPDGVSRAVLGPDSDDFRREVTNEVAAVDLRALTGRIVVLRTKILDEAQIERLFPWRTLSDVEYAPRVLNKPAPSLSVDFVGELWERSKPVRQALGDGIGHATQAIRAKRSTGTVLLVVIAIGVVLGIIRPWHRHGPPPARPTLPVAVVQPVLLAWGDGDGGTATASARGFQVSVRLPARVRLVGGAAGQDFSLVQTSAGQVLAWGRNVGGELGDGSTASSARPVPVALPPGTVATQISAGCLHSLALTAGGRVLAWGDNSDGQLGVPPSRRPVTRPVSVPLPGGALATQVSAGCSDSLALTRAGQVLAWGSRAYGQLGVGSALAGSGLRPVGLPGNVHVTQISAGCGFNLALADNGTVYAWGLDSVGQLGRKLGKPYQRMPIKVPSTGPGGHDVTQISAGCVHSLALTSTGVVLAWGDDSYGELGNGAATGPGHQVTQVKLNLRPGTAVIRVVAGYRYSLALTSAHRVFAWGDNANGQLGRAPNVSGSLVPVLAPIEEGPYVITAIGSGAEASHSVAVGQVTLYKKK